jgi:hypothetical protein
MSPQAVFSRRMCIHATTHALHTCSRVLAGNPHHTHIYPCPLRGMSPRLAAMHIHVLLLDLPEKKPADSPRMRKLGVPEDYLKEAMNLIENLVLEISPSTMVKWLPRFPNWAGVGGCGRRPLSPRLFGPPLVNSTSQLKRARNRGKKNRYGATCQGCGLIGIRTCR